MESQKIEDNYTYSQENNTTLDTRPRIWCKFPLKNLLEPLIALRKEKKSLAKNGIETAKNDGLQKMIKFICNSFYGDIASPFFEVSNTVLANNITARARLAVWMASRTLNGILCITDGFQYQPQHVFEINKSIKKPSLSTLSDLKKLAKHRAIKKIDLGKISNWNELFEGKKTIKDFPNIDTLAKNHIDEFWKNYDLEIPYDVEHKIENIGKKLFFIKKAHYSILKCEGTLSHTYRGVNKDEENPIYHQLAKEVLMGIPRDIKTLESTTSYIRRINDYLDDKKKGNKEPILPGFNQNKRKIFKLTNDDLPSKNQIHHIKKKLSQTDYALEILSSKSIKEILINRIQDYLKEEKNF